MSGIDRAALFHLFETLDDATKSKQTLCIIGAAAILANGHTLRQTQDIDVWRPASRLNDRDLARASKSAGVGFNPAETTVDEVYLQLISPGVVQLPGYQRGRWVTGVASETLWQGDHITVVAPPPAIIIASKLVRGDDRDIEDCTYLIEARRLTFAEIRRAIAAIPDVTARDAAEENIVLLSLIDSKPIR